jgi:hypothetical protein
MISVHLHCKCTLFMVFPVINSVWWHVLLDFKEDLTARSLDTIQRVYPQAECTFVSFGLHYILFVKSSIVIFIITIVIRMRMQIKFRMLMFMIVCMFIII